MHQWPTLSYKNFKGYMQVYRWDARGLDIFYNFGKNMCLGGGRRLQ